MTGTPPRPPTGEQHEIRRGDQVAVVTEVGATLRTYDVASRPVVAGFDASAKVEGGSGQILAPWPNRVRDGRYRFDGEDQQLALSEAKAGNAIHGLVRWVGWGLAERGEDWVALTTTVWPQPGYPFLLAVRATYRLSDDGLAVTVEARNEGTRAAPYGVGQHPYVTAGTERVDDAELVLPARTRVVTDERGNPVSTEAVAGTSYDFVEARRIGDLRLDTAYGDLVRGSDGRTRVRLTDPATDGGVEVWMGPTAENLQVFSGDTLKDPAQRRAALAVEPMSCPPGALASGAGLVVLAPGEEHTLDWGVHKF